MLCGEIVDMAIIRGKQPTAFITFDNEDAAKMAVLEYDGMHLNGRTLKFALAMPGEMQQSKIRLLEEKKMEYER